MRARYYSPILKRFINADIVAGGISQAITLNRFAYANGNPVSFVDPFGLSAEKGVKEAENTVKYTQAILVSDRDPGEGRGLPFFGHTRLYLLEESGDIKQWYVTDFFPQTGGSAKIKKNSSAITWKPIDEPLLYVDKLNYVVLTGDFSKSATLAMEYAGVEGVEAKDFGRYNFLFNNCSDYTNEILEAGNIDGMFSQVLGKVNGPISIPVLREFALSVTSKIDSFTDTMVEKGKELKESGTIWGEIGGNALVGTGEFIDGVTNFVGDVAGAVVSIADDVVDFAKKVTSGVTNAIVDAGSAIADGAVSLWNRLFSKEE